MRYASTKTTGGQETVVAVLPLSKVPLWDKDNPDPDTYLVPDEVEKGWVRQGGVFAPPPEAEDDEGGE